MEGSYGRPDGRGQPAISSQPATGNAFKPNVSRSKTKKWVEAVTPNYDGDDWGGDDFDDEDESPSAASLSQPATHTIASQVQKQSMQSPYSSPADTVQPLHIRTQQQAQQQPQRQGATFDQIGVTSPVLSDVSAPGQSSDYSAVDQIVSPASTNAPQGRDFPTSQPAPLRTLEEASVAPGDSSAATPSNAASSFIRPSDIYRRMNADVEKEQTSTNETRASTEKPSTTAASGPAPPSGFPSEQPQVAPLSSNATSVSVNSPTQTRLQQAPELVAHSSDSFATPAQGATASAGDELDEKRISASPKLPNLARVSTFGSDFFSNPSGGVASESAPEKTSTVDEPSKQGGSVAQSIINTPGNDESVTESILSSDNQTTQNAITYASQTLSDIEEEASSPPRNSASVHARETPRDGGLDQVSSAGGLALSGTPASPSEVPPTQPLQFGKPVQDLPVVQPRPVERQSTFETDTSSPVKESDMLRDEIIKTLTPTSPNNTKPGPHPLASQLDQEPDSNRKSRLRDSSYTLGDYDSYWADTNEHPELPVEETPASLVGVGAMPVVPEEETAAVAITNPDPSNEQSAHSQAVADAPSSAISSQSGSQRRRFSWEMESEDVKKPQPQPAATESAISSVKASRDAEMPIPIAAEVDHPREANNDTKQLASPTFTERSVAPEIVVAGVEPSTIDSPMVVQDETPFISQSVSPAVSRDGVSEQVSHEGSRLSLADEKELVQSGTISLVPPSPSLEAHPALAVPQLPASSTSDASFPRQPAVSNMTFREIMDLSTPQERITKFNDARISFATTDSGLGQWLDTVQAEHPEHISKSNMAFRPAQSTVPGQTGMTAGVPPPAQQPYYQQYLNASGPSGSSSPSNRSRLGGLAMPSSTTSSSFGHSGNQLGTKSKELMHSAGKLSKGLLNKGKSKLRGSGEKADTPPSPVQSNPNNPERRSSWALSLGGKLRTEFSQQQEPSTTKLQSRENSISAPQLPEPAPLSPFISDPESEKSFKWNADSELNAGSTTDGRRRDIKYVDQVPVSPVEERVVVKPSAREVPSGAAHLAQPNTQSTITAAENHDKQFVSPAATETEPPKRQTSFIGLPPIRRSSTFGVTKARKAKERFLLDDDDDDEMPPLGAYISEESVPAQISTAAPTKVPPEGTAPNIKENTAAGVTVLGDEKGDAIIIRERAIDSPELTPQSTGAQQGQVHMAQPPAAPDRSQIHPQQVQLVPAGDNTRYQTQNAMSAPPLVNPAQRLATSGPWKLEESHLAEPLHQVSRNRSGPGGSPPEEFGFDKETGLPGIAAPQVPFAARPRGSDTPPSSAQRYPGLFAPDGRGPPQQASQYPANMYREDIVDPRAQKYEYEIPGVGPPTEERGRERRNSGIFKEIGNRIVRAASRERRSSFSEHRPSTTDVRGDAASDSSLGIEEHQKERRPRTASFLRSLGSRASMDRGGDRQGFGAPPQRSQTEMPSASQSDLRSEQKRSFLGTITAAQNKLFSSSSSHLATGDSNGGYPSDGVEDAPSKKKRFSDVSKLFHRSKQDQSPERRPAEGPSSSMYGANEVPSRTNKDASRLHFFGRERGDGVAGPMDPQAPPPANSGDDSSAPRRGRRGSAAGLLSNLVGRRFGSPQREQNVQPAGQPQHPHTQQLAMASSAYENIPNPPAQRHRDHDELSERTKKRLSQQIAGDQRHPSPLGREIPAVNDQEQNAPKVNEPPAEIPKRPLSFVRQASGEQAMMAQRNAAMGSGTSVNPSGHGEPPLTNPLERQAPVGNVDTSEIWTPTEPSTRSSFDRFPLPTPPKKSAVSEKEQEEDNQDDAKTERGDNDALVRTDTSTEQSVPGTEPVSSDSRDFRPSVESSTAPSIADSRQDGFAEDHRISVQFSAQSTEGSPVPGPSRVVGNAPIANKGSVPDFRGSQPRNQFNTGGTVDPRWPQPTPQHHQVPDEAQPQSFHTSRQYEPLPTQQYQHQQQHQQQPPPSSFAGNSAQPIHNVQQGGPGNFYAQQAVPASGSAPLSESQSSRWKGIKNRVSGQMATLTQSVPKDDKVGKPDKADKISGTKLLGAFKRNSKQPNQSGQSQQFQQFQQPSQFSHSQQRPLPPSGPPMQHPSSISARSNLPPQNQPGAGMGSYSSSYQHQHQHQHQQHLQQPPYQPQQASQPRQDYQSQPQPPPSFAEPKYDAVPIPQGYTAVRGEGSLVPSPYYVGSTPSPHQHNYAYRTHNMAPQGYFQHEQHQPGQNPGNFVSMPANLSHQTSNDTHVNPQATGSSGLANPQISQEANLQSQQHMYSQNSVTSLNDNGSGQASQISQENNDPRQKPAPPLAVEVVQQPHVRTGALRSEGKSAADSGVVQPSQPTSTAKMNTTKQPEGGTSVKDPLKLVVMGNDDRVSIASKSSHGTAKGQHLVSPPLSVPSNTQAATMLELEDTEEARKRTLRIASQEEKIVYDPAEHGEPQMSATSYPGQEWNPFGVADYDDWAE